MPTRRFDTGRDALEFISTLSTFTSPEEIVSALRDKLASYGYHAFLITGLPDYGDRIDPLVMVNGWPDGWFDLYLSRSFSDHDPIAAHCKTTTDAFVWSSVYSEYRAGPREQEVMHRARDFAMVDGFCVPIHNEDGFQAVVTMAGDHPDQSRETCSAIHLMSIYAHSKARSCAEPTSGAHLLTTREREVLAWLAVGRSTPAVAERLGVTDNTVETHFRSAARKMKVRGRTHAVIEAIRRGEIVP